MPIYRYNGPSSEIARLPKPSAAILALIKALQRKLEWRVNYDDALKEAYARGGRVMAYFSGSDWCPHCKALNQEVFESVQFRFWFNSNNLVPLLVDFPSGPKPPQSEQLCSDYHVVGFPTVIALGVSASCPIGGLPGSCTYAGTELGRIVGYTSGNPGQWMTDFSNILN